MNNYIDRMTKEAKELSDKILKLNEFVSSSDYDELSYANKFLLKQQGEAMEKYLQILNCRIELNNAV